MLLLPLTRRTGSIRPLQCAVRRLNTAVASTTSVPNPFILHNTPISKAAGTNIEISADKSSTLPKFREQPGQIAQIESVQRQLQSTATSPAFYQAVAQILKFRNQYIKDRSVFVRGEDMLPILRGLGASDEDIQALPSTSDSLVSDPSLPFRTSANSRFCFDWDTRSMRRVEHQPFMLSKDEDFHRFDSGRVRHFDEVLPDAGLNSAFLAVLLFKAMMVNGVDIAKRSNLNYDLNQWVCTAFNIRTHTTPDLLGEPALEGIHSDGVDHTLVTFLGAKNMAENSAATFLHSMDEVTGIPLSESSPLKIVGHHRHSTYLDTMMIIDHERKHSLTPVYAVDKTQKATRDVLIFFTRRPYLNTHPAASYDSTKLHTTLGVQVPLVDIS